MKTDRFLVETLDNVELFDGISSGKTRLSSFYKFPYISWPNGTPCLIANLYLLHLSGKHAQISADGRLLDRKGGTLGQYASYVSQFIRRCWIKKVDPFQIDDRFFEDFIISIIEELSQKRTDKKKRIDQTTRAIGRECLKFLKWVGDFHGDPKFVSPEGTIKTSLEKIISNFNAQHKVTTTETHHSFPLPFREHTRDPIPQHNIKRLEAAVDESKKSDFIKSRDRALIALLQYTGARRAEIASITLKSIRNAQLMKYPMLNMITVKRGEVHIREVPVSAIALLEVKEYISERQHIQKEHPKQKNDYLFISETTGKPLAIETHTKTISDLREAARIPEQACAHMFRHAFIGNLFTLLIERHKFNSKDEFEQALINDEVFLKKVQEWTGHKSLRSLRTYLQKVFKYNENVNEAVQGVHESQTLKLYQEKDDALFKRMKEGKISPDEYGRKREELQELRDRELSRYHE
ncbi:site-specific integrase [Pseudomonas sp. RC10]|uniref:tyrosine-type recombinase/integrase n=1 Tax=Pseudomonas bambusae TaxID=3139142 RepID=UPI00313920DA